MAEATATRPARKRAAKTAPAKAAAPAAPAAAQVNEEDGMQKFVIELEHQGDTKSYAKWAPPKDSGCVGNVYVPLGTQRVRMLIAGPASE